MGDFLDASFWINRLIVEPGFSFNSTCILFQRQFGIFRQFISLVELSFVLLYVSPLALACTLVRWSLRGVLMLPFLVFTGLFSLKAF